MGAPGRSLATAAPYLLLDEPTASLDIEHSLAILDLVRRMASAGRAVLMALHDLNSVIRSTDFVYVLHGGAIRETGPPLEALSPRIVRGVFAVRADLVGAPQSEVFRFERLPGGGDRTAD